MAALLIGGGIITQFQSDAPPPKHVSSGVVHKTSPSGTPSKQVKQVNTVKKDSNSDDESDEAAVVLSTADINRNK